MTCFVQLCLPSLCLSCFSQICSLLLSSTVNQEYSPAVFPAFFLTFYLPALLRLFHVLHAVQKHRRSCLWPCSHTMKRHEKKCVCVCASLQCHNKRCNGHHEPELGLLCPLKRHWQADRQMTGWWLSLTTGWPLCVASPVILPVNG